MDQRATSRARSFVDKKADCSRERLTANPARSTDRPPPNALTKASFRVQHVRNARLRSAGATAASAAYSAVEKYERAIWHQTLKNRILLENYFLPGDLEAQIEAFVDDDNHHRYHESINNLTPADVYFRRGSTILAERERIKRHTIQNRRLQYQLSAA
jgi:hypothetical protein